MGKLSRLKEMLLKRLPERCVWFGVFQSKTRKKKCVVWCFMRAAHTSQNSTSRGMPPPKSTQYIKTTTNNNGVSNASTPLFLGHGIVARRDTKKSIFFRGIRSDQQSQENRESAINGYELDLVFRMMCGEFRMVVVVACLCLVCDRNEDNRGGCYNARKEKEGACTLNIKSIETIIGGRPEIRFIHIQIHPEPVHIHNH